MPNIDAIKINKKSKKEKTISKENNSFISNIK
jgi:hypothetical protein